MFCGISDGGSIAALGAGEGVAGRESVDRLLAAEGDFAGIGEAGGVGEAKGGEDGGVGDCAPSFAACDDEGEKEGEYLFHFEDRTIRSG